MNLRTLRIERIPVRVIYLGGNSVGVKPLVDQGGIADRDWPFFGSGEDAITFPVPNETVKGDFEEGDEAIIRLQGDDKSTLWFLEEAQA